MNEFTDQVAVVTGAAQGIGFAIAKLLFDRGAKVCLLDVDADKVAASAGLLSNEDRAAGFTCDVTDETALSRTRDEIISRYSKVDVLVNNAGIYPHASFREISVADWDRVFDVNTKSMFLTTRTFCDGMAEQGYGRIVSIVTTDAYIAKPTMPHYAASKAAVANLVKTFALELGPSQVLVNGVSPGAVATERAKSQSWLKERIKQIPVGHAAEPEDIAEVVAFLASRRNRFINGETVIANGGATMI